MRTSAFGTTSGILGGIGSVHNVCHSLCVTVVSILAIFGITTSILPLMFLQTYQMYFWLGALVFTAASLYFYLKQRSRVVRDRNLLFINSGLLIFGLPFPQLADYIDFFRFMGISLAVGGLFLLLFAKKFQNVWYSPEQLTTLSINNSSQNPTSTIRLPRLSVSTALFILVIGGFLINQYFMYRMGIFDKTSTQHGSVVTSAMKPLSQMKLTPFDVVLAKERMDKNNDGICDVCGMPIDQCISSGQIDCNMGNNPQAIGVLGSQHIHADWKIYINGEEFDWSLFADLHSKQMAGDTSITNTSAFIHIHPAKAPEKDGDVLHMHATKVPLWMFFKSIGMKLDKISLTLDDGRVLKNENGNTLKFYLDGKKVDELVEYVYQDLDKLLISYGPENDPDIDNQINSVTNFAKDHQK